MASRTPRTPKKPRDWKPAWLAAFEREGMVSAACKTAKVGRSTVYDARSDPDFAKAWDDIEASTTDRMESESLRRGMDGFDKAVYHQGQVVGKERQYSDTLLIFMLKARKPETYRENVKVEHAGVITQQHEVDLTALSPDEKRALLALVEKAADAPAVD